MTGSSASSAYGSRGRLKCSRGVTFLAVAVRIESSYVCVGELPQIPVLRGLEAQVVLQRLDAAHFFRRADRAVRHVATVDEARELHHALVGLDVDRRGGARADVGGDRGLHLGGERRIFARLADAALGFGGGRA